MKKPIVFVAAGITLFAAGYWAGNCLTSAEPPDTKQGPVAAAAIAARAAETSGKSNAASPDRAIRPFTAGKPFAKGGAKAWLLSLAAELGGEPRDIETGIIDIAQIFMTMDEACAAETCEALIELMALLEAGEPALKAINDADDLGEGAYMLTVFRLSQLNPAAALEALKRLPKGVPDEATKIVFARLAGQNPARAEELVATLPAKQQGDALEGIFKSLAGKDPLAALAFAEKYPTQLGGYDRDRVLRDLMKKSPQQGISAAVSITEKTKDSTALQNAFNNWLQHDQNAAMAWAAQHSGPGHAAVQATVIQQQAEGDPQAAVAAFAKLDSGSADKKDLSRAAATIVHKLVEQDPASAQSWLGTLQDGAAKDSATNQLATSWTQKDPSAASGWIKTLPAGDVRDAAARDLVRRITTRDPAAAYEWAGSISNEASRKETMEQVMSVWKDVDPEGAKDAGNAASPTTVTPAGR